MMHMGSGARGRRGLATVLLLAAATGACGEGEATEAAPSLQTGEVIRQDLRITAEATGQLEPLRQVEVKSRASGEILELLVDTGDQVEAGALMARIDPREVENAYSQAVADLDVARARVEISRSQMERSQQLLEAGVITPQENESATLEMANSQAALVRAETNKSLAELRRSDVTIRAPLAGTILQKSVEEGMVIQSASGSVSGGTTLFIMAALDRMQVRTLVDETDVGKIIPGMDAVVRVEAFPNQLFQGSVEKIEPQAVVEQNVTNFPVIVTLDNQAGLLKPGMNGDVEVLISERPRALLLPNSAVVGLAEVGAAALVLGLDPEAIQIDLSVFATLGTGGGGAAAPGGAEMAAGGQRGGAAMDSLRAQVARGEISQDSLRALMAARATAGGAAPGARPGGARAAGGGRPGAARQASAPGEPQPAVTFVIGADGIPTPRPILIGLNDWDNTEVLGGLEEGERVALIGAAQLQARRQEMLERFRGATGGMFPGGGGMPRMR